MKIFWTISLSFLIFAQVSSFFLEEEEVIANGRIVARRRHRELTPEEWDAADEAKADIARAIENNLIRILAIATAQNEDPIPRQEGDDDDFDIPTPNPNVLPQVAQILGAIFSGTLNITRVVDGTFGLVPNIVRGQLQGLVKLLTGENVNLGGSTTVSPLKGASSSEPDAIFEEEPSTVVPLNPKTTTPEATSPPSTEKTKYKVRIKTKGTTPPTTPKATLVDDEVDRIERDLRAAGRIMEPYETRDSRFYAGMFGNVMQNVNMTEVAKTVPTIFKGATQALLLLENLGLMGTLPGTDVLEDLEDSATDAPAAEEEE